QSAVSQIFNLLTPRRGLGQNISQRPPASNVPQTANLRYSRLKICATCRVFICCLSSRLVSKLQRTRSRLRLYVGSSFLGAVLLMASPAHLLPGERAVNILPNSAPPGMALISGGAYRPLFRTVTDLKEVPVKPFCLDLLPVT